MFALIRIGPEHVYINPTWMFSQEIKNKFLWNLRAGLFSFEFTMQDGHTRVYGYINLGAQVNIIRAKYIFVANMEIWI